MAPADGQRLIRAAAAAASPGAARSSLSVEGPSSCAARMFPAPSAAWLQVSGYAGRYQRAYGASGVAGTPPCAGVVASLLPLDVAAV